MATWRVEIGPEAEEELAVLDRAVYLRVVEKLEWLGRNFSSISPLLLRYDRAGEFKLRVGDHRVLYRVKNKHTLFVLKVDHRSRIYKKKK
ncbi:MAG: type II toxin-antitoxin system RelE/ParE family toxin [bacterium]|nr:type II toxin-antitoxin system RelE/ParE family toxin [bacterium]